MKGIITWSSYTYNEITLYGRAEDGSRFIRKFTPDKPYFYVAGNGPYKSLVRNKKTNEEISLVKIEVDTPLQVKSERTKYPQTWEADIPFLDRVLHDKGIRKAIDLDTLEPVQDFYVEPRKVYLDIENDDSDGFPDPDKAEKEVFCFTMIDSFTNIAIVNTTKPFLTKEFLEKIGHIKFRLIFHSNETTMLTALNSYLRTREYQPDVILGWNVDEFDVKYLYNRMKKLNIPTDGWEGILVFDLLKGYRRWKENKQKSYKLDYIANQELGYGKIERKEKVSKMTGLDMAVYNYMDSYICYDLDKKLGLFRYFYDLSEFTGTVDISRWNASYIWDAVLLNRLRGTGIILPSAEKDEKVGVPGGFVLKATIGFFRNVKVLDFKSEYPNMMFTFNMSPDSIDPNGEIIFPTIRFRKEPLGLIPTLLKEFIERRDAIKKQMKSLSKDSMEYKSLDNSQRVLKEVTNSIYGLMGNEHYRLYDERIQAAITYGAREHIKYVVSWLESKNSGKIINTPEGILEDNTMELIEEEYNDDG